MTPSHTTSNSEQEDNATLMGKEQELLPLEKLLEEYDRAVEWHSYRLHDVNREAEQHRAAAKLAEAVRADLAARRSSSDEQAEVVEPVAFLSAGQFETLGPDPDDGGGAAYLPIRHTADGNFQMALYASPSGVKAGVTEELIAAIDDVLLSGRAIYPNGTAYKSLKAVVSRARSALGVGDEGMGEGWQPIETAPKDGSVVLLFGQYWSDELGWFKEALSGRWIEARERWEAFAYHEYPFGVRPTLWQPLPTPPIQGDAK